MSVSIDKIFIDEFINANFGLPIAHENIDYAPTAGTPFVQLRVLQNAITPLSYSDSNDTDGVFRVILNYPSGTGAITAKTKADEILSVFKIGARLQYESQTLTITNVYSQPGENSNGWYKIVLTIGYYAVLNR